MTIQRSAPGALAVLCAVLLCSPLPAGGSDAPGGPAQSYLTRLWELDPASRRAPFGIGPHNGNYVLPFTYESSPNEQTVQAAEPDRTVQKAEVKFQISFKTKLWQDVLGKPVDLWLGYTQLSFWQFYNVEDSAPFRETDYEPELLFNVRTDVPLAGLRCRSISAGFNHQSNGRAEPLSRSWNRIVANAGLENDNLVVVVTGWYRIPEKRTEDDNPGIERFVGYGRIGVSYGRGGHRVGAWLRNNLRARGNKGSLQLDWTFPLIERLDGYVQYFNGYGESLLDYNASANRIGIGFRVKEL